MSSICGADCSACKMKDECRGCAETCGSPFRGKCIAAEYIRFGGKTAYETFKRGLLDEINALLAREGLPKADALYELCGAFVNLEYSLPSVYLGSQIEFADLGVCYGVVADKDFILVCSYSVNGSEPEIIIYKRR